MKKILLFLFLITNIILLSNCKKDSGSTEKSLDNGTYNASGTISFKSGSTSYSIPIYSVTKTSSSLSIEALELTTNISLSVVSLLDVSTGTYAIPSTSLTLTLNTVIYNASIAYTSSACTITINTLSSTSIKGTFSATVVPYVSGSSNLQITNGVITCTIIPK